MEALKFKSNIKCSGCVAKVTPYLNEIVGNGKWEVDLTDSSKVLTVTGEPDATKIVSAIEKAGYRAEKI
jgi:copper chaperone CopZ